MQEVRMRNGNKKIYHLEAWVVKVMSLYKVRHANPRIEIAPSLWPLCFSSAILLQHRHVRFRLMHPISPCVCGLCELIYALSACIVFISGSLRFGVNG